MIHSNLVAVNIEETDITVFFSFTLESDDTCNPNGDDEK